MLEVAASMPMRRLGKLAKPPPVRHDLVLIGMRLQISARQCGQGEAQALFWRLRPCGSELQPYRGFPVRLPLSV
jgi:hypothetical protein